MTKAEIEGILISTKILRTERKIMLNVAMLSQWHVHADGYANTLIKTGKVNIKAVWDEDEKRGSAWAERLGAKFYSDLDELLADKEIQAVICDAPTTMHKEILVKAANAGKHIFTEKAVAPTVAECEEVEKAVEKNGVVFTVSMPHKCMPINKFVKKLISEGAFGKVTLIRIRNAHNGVSGNWLPKYWFDESKAAGGAMMDLGCHAMYLLDWFLGAPKSYAAAYNSMFGTPVDENAAAVIEFENGALGVSETSFISYCSPYIVEVHGTEGVLVSVGGDVKFRNKETDKYANGFITPALPAEDVSPLEQFVDACVNGKESPAGFTIKDGIALTRLLEETYKVNCAK